MTDAVLGDEGEIKLHADRVSGIRIENDHGHVVLTFNDLAMINERIERFKIALLQFEDDE